MNQRDLESFVKVVEAGSFSRAALLLSRPQPALSRHVRDLEADLRVPLLYRNGRGVVLTEAGRRLYARATAILEQIVEARSEALSHAAGGPESVTIGLPPSLVGLLAPGLTRALYAAYPGLRLNFIEALDGHLLEWLTGGRIDIAVLYAGEAAQRLHAETLFEEPLHLVAADDLPARIPAATLRNAQLILPSRAHGLRRQIDLWSARHGIGLTIRSDCDSLAAALQLVAAGLGCTILPESAIRAEIARGDLVSAPIVDPVLHRGMILATPTNRPMPAGLADIARLIKREVGGLGLGQRRMPAATPAPHVARRQGRGDVLVEAGTGHP